MNRLLRRGLLTCLALSACAAFAATNSAWSVHVWQSDDGLPNNNVTGLAQSPDGYLWVASPGRLARFDGVQFDDFSYRNIHPEVNQRVNALTVGHDGSLWLALDHGGVVQLNGGAPRIFTNGLPNQLALTITEDGEGGLWIVYRANLVCRIKDGQVTRFNNELPPGYGFSLAKDHRGRLWFARLGQVGLFHDGRFDVSVHLDRVPTRIAAAADGGLWICLGNRLVKYTGAGVVEERGLFHPESPVAEPTALLEDRNGILWIGTSDSGLFRYDGFEFENVPISHREVLCLATDAEGNLWVGTGGGGLNRVSPRPVKLEGAESGLPFEAVQSLTEDTNGTLWATTQTGSLVSRTNERWVAVENLPNPRTRVSCVSADRDGGVWVGTYNYELLCRRDGRFTTWGRNEGLTGHTIHALLAARNGDVWIGEESPDIVQRLHDGKIETFKVPSGLRIIRAIAEDTAGNIWIGTSKGLLLRIANGEVVDETEHTLGGEMSIRSLLATPDGALWIGFAGFGVGRLHDGRFSHVSVEQGLADLNISQIVADDQGWLWFGADRGIFRVRRHVLESVLDGRAARFGCIQHGRDEGVPSLQANFGDAPGALCSRDGRLWLPMRSALAVVDPKNIREDNNPPQVRLEQVRVDDRTLARYGGLVPVREELDLEKPARTLRLSPRHHRLEFDFTALSFRAPENVRFRYRLDGFDDNWVESGTQRRAAYSRLAAGEYHFQVTACNSDGVWSPTSATLTFVVTPFFWQTWWFRVGVLVLSIGLVRYVSIRRLRHKVQLLEQQTMIEKERARIAKDLHDDLGTRLTKIVLQTGLAQRDAAGPGRSGDHLEKISSMTQQVIKSLDETVWAVNPRNDTLPHLINYISQFAVDFLKTAQIRCRPELPERPPDRTVPARVRHNLFLAVKEALNNIVRHANAGEVQLRMTATERTLEIALEDNGRGFGAEPADASADGLRNMGQRLEELGGECRIESQPGAGTRIVFSCPWRDGNSF